MLDLYTLNIVEMVISVCIRLGNIAGKGEMLVTSIFSFFLGVFKSLPVQGHKKTTRIVPLRVITISTNPFT